MASIENINFIYEILLGRNATDSEIHSAIIKDEKSLVSRILNDSSFYDDRFGLSSSVAIENLTTTSIDIERAYQLIFEREPESELDLEAKAIECKTISNLRQVLLQSDEFSKIVNKSLLHFPRENMIDLAYRILLKRVPKATEINLFYTCESNQAVVEEIIGSVEFVSSTGLVNASLLKNKSLLIIGHPKGMTSEIYRTSCLFLKNVLNPSPASDGEILNNQRYLYSDLKFSPIPFLSMNILDEAAPSFLESLYSRLELYSKGFVIKDVLYPAIVYDFLKKYPDMYNVLYVDHDIEKVMSSASKANWNWIDRDAIIKVNKCFQGFNKIDTKIYLQDSQYFYEKIKGIYPEAQHLDYRLNPEWSKYEV